MYKTVVCSHLHTGWTKSVYTVINYILYTYFWLTLYIFKLSVYVLSILN